MKKKQTRSQKKRIAAKRQRDRKAARRRTNSTSAAVQPRSTTASSDLTEGVALLQRGQLDAALACFQRAIRQRPNDAVAHNCVGIVHRAEKRYAEAEDAVWQAIRLRPKFPEAHNNLGNVQRERGELRAAEASYRRAIVLNPQFAEAHSNLGVVLMARNEITLAMRLYQQALQLKPGYLEALNNLGNAYREQGSYTAAAECFYEALAKNPHSPELHSNLAAALRDAGDSESAERHCVEALRLRPDFAEAHSNLGTLHVDRGNLAEAIESYQRAVDLAPDTANYLNNLGNAYKHTRRIDLAMEAFRQVAELEPDKAPYHIRLKTVCRGVLESRAQSEILRQNAITQWREFAKADFDLDLSTLTWETVEPGFNFQFMEGNLRELKEAYAEIFRGRLPQYDVPRRTGKPRVGLVVTRAHEGIFVRSMRGIIERLDPDLCDLVILCSHCGASFIRDNIEREVEFSCFPERFDHTVRAVHDAAVDVLYYWEIGTDTTNYFLPFIRLAPVQCTSWGIQVTSGIKEVDYYLSNTLVEPDNAQEHYTEKLRLADTMLTYQHSIPQPGKLRSREDFGFLPEDHVYACIQQLGKMHPDFDVPIGAILRQDPNAVFVLSEDLFGAYGGRLRERHEKTLADVRDRILFLQYLDQDDYRSMLLAADVLLDPPHFGGVNSTYDALGLGKAIVTEPSEYHRGRYTYGCYQKMGMSDCVATSTDDYIEKALHLAADAELRRSVEAKILETAPVLFEDDGAVAEHERLFAELVAEARAA